MKDHIKQLLKQVLSQIGVTDVVPVVESPADLSHGDYTTNVAMVAAKRLKRNPMEVAGQIVDSVKSFGDAQDKRKALSVKNSKHDQLTHRTTQKELGSTQEYSWLQDIEKFEIAPPGFINFWLSPSVLSKQLRRVVEEGESFGTVGVDIDHNSPNSPSYLKRGLGGVTKKIMVEFAHPNTHKAFHIGHLRNISIGEAIVRLLESQGHEVIRANYQGDVGMHIAKAVYALLHVEKYKELVKSYSSSESAVWRASREVSSEKNKVSSRLRSNNNLVRERVELLGQAYAAGSKAYEEDPAAKQKIHDYNFLIYAAAQRFWQEKGLPKSSTDYLNFVKGRKEEVEEVYQLWKETRQWSLDYFETIYKRVGSRFDRYYFESECLAGVDEAKEAVKRGVLAESEGAIIFNGKPYGLDTRVFVNSLGLPTYEGKELALATTQFKEHGHIDQLIHVLGPEQWSFTQVTFKVEELLGIQKDQQLHLVYGWVRLKQGKMSSRSGNVVLGEWLIDEAKKEIYNILQRSVSKSYEKTSEEPHPTPSPYQGEGRSVSALGNESTRNVVPSPLQGEGQDEVSREEIAEKAAVAAVKYSFLKVSTQQEIAFELKESVSFEGDSGPYLQYTYARARSVLRKAANTVIPDLTGNLKIDSRLRGNDKLVNLNNEELLVLRLLNKFPEIVADAASNYAPNVVCKYLYDLAGSYNTFYNKHTILGSENSDEVKEFRVQLTAATAQVIKNGLHLLGIEVLERM